MSWRTRFRTTCILFGIGLVGLAGTTPSHGATAYTLICFVPNWVTSDDVSFVSFLGSMDTERGATVELGWSECGRDQGIGIAGVRAAIDEYEAPRVHRIRRERAIGGAIAFDRAPRHSAEDWTHRVTRAPDSTATRDGTEIITRGWKVAVDVPSDAEPGSYYIAFAQHRRDDPNAEPLVSYLSIDVRGDEPGRRGDAKTTLDVEASGDGATIEYAVANHSPYTYMVVPGSLDMWSLVDGWKPLQYSTEVKLDPDRWGPAPHVPRDDRRTLRYRAEEVPLLTCAAWFARRSSDSAVHQDDDVVHSLTTLHLPFGTYSWRGSDAEDCDGFHTNPVGQGMFASTMLLGLALVTGTALVLRRFLRRRRTMRAESVAPPR